MLKEKQINVLVAFNKLQPKPYQRFVARIKILNKPYFQELQHVEIEKQNSIQVIPLLSKAFIGCGKNERICYDLIKL